MVPTVADAPAPTYQHRTITTSKHKAYSPTLTHFTLRAPFPLSINVPNFQPHNFLHREVTIFSLLPMMTRSLSLQIVNPVAATLPTFLGSLRRHAAGHKSSIMRRQMSQSFSFSTAPIAEI